ncbi:MAG TPA: AAA family ATPase, partial [Actinomycetota bacterium]|nr:AAA family ATPase [Actinomycetota bacterium]
DLALGRHAEVVPEVERLLAEAPLDERLHGIAMLALYRAGRQADALEVAERLRRRLAEELGIEPSPALRKLEQDILRQAPELEPAPRAAEPEEADRAPRRVRRTVTALACRLRWEAGADPEARLGSAEAAFQQVLHAVASSGGAVHEALGGRVVAVFGIPSAHEDDAARAMVAASRVRELGRSSEGGFSVQAGIASGEVLVEEAGDRRALLSADPLDAADELSRSAPPGEILLDELTLRLAGQSGGVEPATVFLGEEGESSTVAYRLLAPPAGGRRVLETGFVGRRAELDLLRQTFDRAVRERTPALVTVLGPAGIGKSRLIAEFAAEVGERAAVLAGRCLSFGTDVTFWPIAEIVRQAAGAGGADPPAELRARIGELLEGTDDAGFILDQVAGVLGISEGPPSPDEIFWAIRKLFEALARRRPLILVLDDVHWAETTLLDLVEHIATWATDAPLLLACLARPDLLERRPGWGSGRFDSVTVSLKPLPDEDAEALLANLLPGGVVTEAARELILDAAEGNPLFLEELVAMLIENGTLRWRDGDWVLALGVETVPVPVTVQALIRARLDRLPARERRVLELAAVVGKEFSLDDLAALTDEEPDRLSRTLEHLVGRDVVVPLDGGRRGAGAYRFRHLLIRDVVYGSTAKRTRAELHERFGESLERRAGDRLPEFEELIGYHLEAAYRLRAEIGLEPEDDLRRRAAERLASAGRRSFARNDMPAAASLLGRAVDLLGPDDPAVPDLSWRLAVALYETGELGRADEVLERAMALAERLGDGRAGWRLRMERADLRLWREPERADAEEVIRLAREAAEALGEVGDDAGVARAYRLMGDALNRLGRQEEALRAFEEGAGFARKAGDEREIEERRGIGVTLGPMPVPEAIELVRGIVEGSPRPNVEALGQLGLLQGMAGRFDEARRLLDDALARAREQGAEWKAVAISIGYASTLLLADDVEGAERHARWALDRLQDMGERSLLSSAAALLAEILYRSGRLDEAMLMTTVSEAASAPDDVASQVGWRSARAKVLAATGDLEAAERLAREAVARGEPTDYLNMRGEAHADLATVLRAAGKAEEADRALEAALELFRRKGNEAAARRLLASRDAPAPRPSGPSSKVR